MKADNQQNRNHKPLHLVDTEPAQIVSDRTVLRRFLAQYRQTGQCETLPQLIEIGRLARQGRLIALKEARILLTDLAKIESDLPHLIIKLTTQVTALLNQEKYTLQKGEKQILSPEASFQILQTFTNTVELWDRLIAIARNHPDPPEPGAEEGFAPCYVDTIKRVNDLRYNLAYLSEYLRPQHLAQECDRCSFPDLQLGAILNVINDLYCTAMILLPRLRENITRKLPQMFGSVPDCK